MRSFSLVSVWSLVVVVALSGCGPGEKPELPIEDAGVQPPDAGPGDGECQDLDGDGYGPNCGLGYDCDDTDPAINPGATEVCNGKDDNCDGKIDNNAVGATSYYEDSDGDGFGNEFVHVIRCGAGPTGYVTNHDDCDDSNATIHPSAAEVCNNRDDNCNGQIDEDAIGRSTWYVDSDQDGYGDGLRPVLMCPPSDSSHVANGNDCDDSSASVHPGATETCDGRDNDCDGSIDEAGAVGELTYYALDQDGDGYGDPASELRSCTPPMGQTQLGGDCDDLNAAVHPGADETCDGTDENCNGIVDEDPVGTPTYFADADGDGFGDPNAAFRACALPPGAVEVGGDCDDSLASVHPGATELCNAVDDDCNGLVDDGATDQTTFYTDADGDGHGDASAPVTACFQPAGTVLTATDCDDLSATVHPGADETCNAVDDDCDGTIDEDPTDTTPFYVDADGDGAGDSSQPTLACSAPAGMVATGGDCDDTDPARYPGAAETCNGVDDDCDGTIDEDAIDAVAHYADLDGDSYGDIASEVRACNGSVPADRTTVGGDCDDTLATVNPAATELCNGVDDDCDGAIDDDASDRLTFYSDVDADGFGDANSPVLACVQPAGTVTSSTDCNDLDANVHPGASETCNAIDDDCDGLTDEEATDAATFYVDADGDGHGDASQPVLACSAPADTSATSDDCNDSDAAVHPGADERCNGEDDDCDGTIDEDAVDRVAYFTDADLDGYGDPATEALACTPPASTVARGGDCDEANPSINPGANELCGNGVDENCDGAVDPISYCQVFVCTSCAEANDASNDGTDANPFKTIAHGISTMNARGGGLVKLALASGADASEYAENLTLVEGVSLQGRYVRSGASFTPTGGRTVIRSSVASGLQIPAGITPATRIEGVRVLLNATTAGANVAAMTVTSASPMLDDLEISSVGVSPSPANSVGLDLVGTAGAPAAPILSGTASSNLLISSGAATAQSIGVRVSGATLTASHVKVTAGTTATGTTPAGSSIGVSLQDATGSVLTSVDVSGGSAATCTGVLSAGASGDVRITQSKIRGCPAGVTTASTAYGAHFQSCTVESGRAAPRLDGNVEVLSGSTAASGVGAGVRAVNGCPLRIDGNSLIAGPNGAIASHGVECTFGSGTGLDSACVVEGNTIQSGTSAAQGASTGILCNGSCLTKDDTCMGSCATVADNRVTCSGGVRWRSVDVVHASPTIARNTLGSSSLVAADCNSNAVAIGLRLEGSASRVENNFILGSPCATSYGINEQVSRRTGGSGVVVSPDVHSNTIIGGGLDSLSVTTISYGVVLDLAANTTLANAGTEGKGRYRSNIIIGGRAADRVAFQEGCDNCDPKEFRNNDLFNFARTNFSVVAAALYLDESGAPRSIAQVNDVNDPTTSANVSEDPLFVSGTDRHLQANSGLKTKGLDTEAPAGDIDGDARPSPTGTDPDIGADELP